MMHKSPHSRLKFHFFVPYIFSNSVLGRGGGGGDRSITPQLPIRWWGGGGTRPDYCLINLGRTMGGGVVTGPFPLYSQKYISIGFQGPLTLVTFIIITESRAHSHSILVTGLLQYTPLQSKKNSRAHYHSLTNDQYKTLVPYFYYRNPRAHLPHSIQGPVQGPLTLNNGRLLAYIVQGQTRAHSHSIAEDYQPIQYRASPGPAHTQ